MPMNRVVLVSLIGVAAAAGVVALGMWSKPPRPEDPPEKKFPIGKATTVADGPLDKDGYVDFEAAFNERLGKGITQEKNSNVLLWKALGPRPEGGTKGMPPEYFKALGIDEPPATGDYLVGTYRFATDYLKLEGEDRQRFVDQNFRAMKQPWAAKDLPNVAAWIAVNEKPLAVVYEAVKRPEYFNPLCSWKSEAKGPSDLLGVLLPNVQKCREVGGALAARAMLRVDDGKFDESWQDLYACHRLSRLLSRGGTLIEFLVSVALDSIASTATVAYLDRADLTADQARGRLKDLQDLPPMAPMADKFDLASRFTYLDGLQLIRRGGVTHLEALSGGKNEKPTPAELRGMARIDWEPALKDGNKWFDRMTAAARAKTRAERNQQMERIEQDVKELKEKTVGDENSLAALIAAKAGRGEDMGGEIGQAINNVLIGLLLPAAGKVMSAADRAEQTQKNLQIAFALAAYRKDNGKYPEKLDALAPKYLAAVPPDVFSGKPLIYKPDGKGYLFYSVGPNEKDDGGRSIDDDPPGDDLVVRMPVPALKAKD
jgi:hypothetical protein